MSCTQGPIYAQEILEHTTQSYGPHLINFNDDGEVLMRHFHYCHLDVNCERDHTYHES